MQMLVNSHRARALRPLRFRRHPLGDRFALKRRTYASRSSPSRSLIVLRFALVDSCLSSLEKKDTAKEDGLGSADEKARYLVDIPRYLVRNKRERR